jgi:hypothetical protein
MQATLIAPITPSQNRRNCSLIGFPLFGIAGSLADNAKMTAIQFARKRILYGNTIWKRPPCQGSAYSFLVLLIRFYEGARLTHQTSEWP